MASLAHKQKSIYEVLPSIESTTLEATAVAGTLYVPFASACCTAATFSMRTSEPPEDCEIPVPAALTVAWSAAGALPPAGATGCTCAEETGETAWFSAGVRLDIEFTLFELLCITTVFLLTCSIGAVLFFNTARGVNERLLKFTFRMTQSVTVQTTQPALEA
jgi:hypothetical protein